MDATRQAWHRAGRWTWMLVVLWLGGCGTERAVAGEAERIAEAMGLQPGMQVADVGAGDGEWAEVLARGVGPGGRVYATEVAGEKLDTLRQRLADLDQVTVLRGDVQDTGLPAQCCDAILLRQVYHHFTDPTAMRASLRQALRPGGRLVIIDITPQADWARLPGVPERDGHGITPDDLVAEMTAGGFEVIAHYPDWGDEEDRFCIVFRPFDGR